MSIHKTSVNKKLTIFTVIGETTFEELMATLETFYAETPSLDILWDIRQGTLTKPLYNDIHTIAANVDELTKKSRRRKTAIVTAREVDYGIGRIFGTFAEMKEGSVNIQVFREYDEAMVWLGTNSNSNNV